MRSWTSSRLAFRPHLPAWAIACLSGLAACAPLAAREGAEAPAAAEPATGEPSDRVPAEEDVLRLLGLEESDIPTYSAVRLADGESIVVDGRLDEPAWKAAVRSPRFVDLVNGREARFDTRAAVRWDDEFLYVGYWVEEPDVAAELTRRDAPIYTENDVEIFIDGAGGYYELEINALGTLYEAFFVWEDAYEEHFAALPGFRRDGAGVIAFNGVEFTTHPRGPRIGFMQWDFPGLRSAVHVDGTLNDPGDRDAGWTVEFALPWKGMEALAVTDGRALPPKDGDVWRIDFSRFNKYPSADSPESHGSKGWAWSRHGAWDSHIPECFVRVTFSR